MADGASPILLPAPASPAIGREREMRALREALAAAIAGRGAPVPIGGKSGVGKTAPAGGVCAEVAA